MTSQLLDRINNETNIHEFITEDDIVQLLRNHDATKLNWMRIFNSKILLSNEFIVKHIEYIDWNWMTRQMDESILIRYGTRIVQWNCQLYGKPRTFEFLTLNQGKFDWNMVSRSPPDWFNDIHFENFGSMMDWHYLTKFSKKMDVRIISKYSDKLDWEWISANDIRSESFALRFIRLINWDHPALHKENLTDEFLNDLQDFREIADDMNCSKASQIRFLPLIG